MDDCSSRAISKLHGLIVDTKRMAFDDASICKRIGEAYNDVREMAVTIGRLRNRLKYQKGEIDRLNPIPRYGCGITLCIPDVKKIIDEQEDGSIQLTGTVLLTKENE